MDFKNKVLKETFTQVLLKLNQDSFWLESLTKTSLQTLDQHLSGLLMVKSQG